MKKETNKDEKEADYQTGKVLIETESFKAYEPINKDKSKKDFEDMDIHIDYKGMKIGMGGFTSVKRKTDKKIVFAFKWKHEQKNIIYYKPQNLTEEENRNADIIITELKKTAGIIGYNITNAYDFLENVYSQKHIFDKLAEKKNDNKES